MNTITIELCAEDRARLDSILEQLRQLNQMPAVFDGKEPEKKQQTATKQEPKQEPKQESAPTIQLTDLQTLVQELASPGSGKRDKVKALVKGYAERVSLIPQDKWPEVYEALTALKKEG